MAENETAVAEQQEEQFQYAIKVEDAGPATKKVYSLLAAFGW